MSAFVAVDSETHLIQPGLLAPPGVCTAFYDGSAGWVEPFDQGLDTFEGLLRPGVTLAGFNLFYDLAVACSGSQGGRYQSRPALLRPIFEKVERGEIFDLMIAFSLDQIAKGTHLLNPITKGPIQKVIAGRGMAGQKMDRYNLEIVYHILTGRDDAKEHDDFKLKYAELEKFEIETWPNDARQYPIDDARNAYVASMILRQCGQNLTQLARHPWTHLEHNTRAAWALHLSSCWGLRADPIYVEKLKAKAEEKYAALRKEFTGVFLREDGTEDQASVKREVILAYGGAADQKCSTCNGTGKVPGKSKGKINCKDCFGTTLVIPEHCPRTETNNVSIARDTKEQSGSELLERYAQADEYEKIRETYIPFLLGACKHPAANEYNPMLDSARASNRGLMQTFPKIGGARECLIPDLGYWLCSVDYNALEFATLAQVCLWIVGFSRMAEAVNAGKDAHCMLGANMVGLPYEEFLARYKGKEPGFDGTRFACKAGNYGFGGLMGAAKFALTQRRQKPFKDKNGHAHGSMCRVSGMEARTGIPCGTKKIYEWKRRPTGSPVCEACVFFSEDLRNAWLSTWEEMPLYFKWVTALPGVQDGEGAIRSPGTGYVRGGMNASAAANHPFQHLAAYGAKYALWETTKEMYLGTPSALVPMSGVSPLLGSRLANFSHDEEKVCVPQPTRENPRSAHDAAYRLRDVMVAAMKSFVPDVAIGAEPALMLRDSKKAEAKHDASGLLIPWDLSA